MAKITADKVKALREQTGLGMMDCKKALQESDGDMDAAADILRKKGLATAEKKSARTTSEGRVTIKTTEDGTSAAMVEIRCETDFCARNHLFVELADKVAEIVLTGPDGQAPANDEITKLVQDALAKIGENMKYVRGIRISAGTVHCYTHHNSKVGVLVGIEGKLPKEVLNDLCMHIAFADPVGISAKDVPAELIEKEKAFATEEAAASGKPPQIVEKIVAGKMAKFIAGKALLEQAFVRDDKKKVSDILGDAKVTGFARYAVGE